MNPVIVVNAYNRPASLQRLLSSIHLADIPVGVDIVFSLEFGAHDDVVKQVEQFEWPHGRKNIIRQQTKQGLVGHFLFCGGLTEKYGSIIYLEDDLFVGKHFYHYAGIILNAYGDDKNIAGFSLNALWFNGYLHLPFLPINDGNPCFFLQVPWYQGQVYTPTQWAHFKQWYDAYQGMDSNLLIHDMFRHYKLSDDWFPLKTQYLIETGKYYCFPRVSHCVNFGDVGTHFGRKTNFFQAELSMGIINASYISFSDAHAVYDSFYELRADKYNLLSPLLSAFDFEPDLNGTKNFSRVQKEYVITPVRPVAYVQKFGFEMRPQELNVIYSIAGDHFYLTKTADAKTVNRDKAIFYDQFFYYHRFKLSRRQRWRILLRDG